MSDDESLFNEPKVQQICNEEIAKVLDGTVYKRHLSDKLTEQIVNNIIQRITPLFSPRYKYITHAIYMDSAVQGFDCYNQNEWETDKDSYIITEYDNGSVKFNLAIWGLFC